MGDPYRRFGAPADRGSVPIPSFPGYLSSEPSSLTSHHPRNNFSDLQGNASDYLRKDVLPLQTGPYGVDVTGVGVRPEYSLGGLTAGASINAHPAPLQDAGLLSQRRDIALGVSPGIPDLINDRPNSLRKVDGLPVPAGESNILFVEGLPNDCLRREVGHLFRPFIGFKDIRVVHREPRRSGDKSMVLCFVEFDNAKCALTAMEALQGYKFDDKKPDSPVLRIYFAHFPFRLPSDRNEQQFGGPR